MSASVPRPEPIFALPGEGRRLALSRAVARTAEALHAAGARPVAVGGCVRDHLLGTDAKDVDLEVYGVDLDTLSGVLAEVGSVHAVGRSFGVLKVSVDDERGAREVIDVALPRRESKVGRGHRGFVVEPDGAMTFRDAAARRDFTCNAMGIDLSSGELLDPFDGAEDLRAGILRHTSPAFDEDPLRVFRGGQLAARFGLEMAPVTVERCRSLASELPTLAPERLFEELKKLLLRARTPSIGLSLLHRTDALSLFPELVALIGCPQEPEWHPEGDVWVHTLMVVDEAARLAREDGLIGPHGDDDEALRLLLGALCHDLGKPGTTEVEGGRIRSKGHEAGGEAPTRTFLKRIGAPHALVDDVVDLVREHLKPFQLYRDRDKVSDGALRRLALRISLPRLVRLARADHFGRTTPDALAREDPAGPWLLEQAERLAVADARPSPLLMGRHLLEMGLAPGPALGDVLKAAFEAQLDGAFADLDGALAWARDRLGSHDDDGAA